MIAFLLLNPFKYCILGKYDLGVGVTYWFFTSNVFLRSSSSLSLSLSLSLSCFLFSLFPLYPKHTRHPDVHKLQSLSIDLPICDLVREYVQFIIYIRLSHEIVLFIIYFFELLFATVVYISPVFTGWNIFSCLFLRSKSTIRRCLMRAFLH